MNVDVGGSEVNMDPISALEGGDSCGHQASDKFIGQSCMDVDGKLEPAIGVCLVYFPKPNAPRTESYFEFCPPPQVCF